MNTRQKKRLELFNQGADAFTSHFQQYGRVYVCPLCLVGYPEAALSADVLTLEHVPPATVGGRQLVLICRACNDHFGAQLDHHAGALEDTIDFEQRTLTRPVNVTVQLNGMAIRAELTRATDEIAIRSLPAPKVNGMQAAAMFDEAMGSVIASGRNVDQSAIRLTFAKQFSHRRSLVSWLRSAYLMAFAVFGYRYILGTELKPIRAQIWDYDESVIRTFSLMTPNAERSQRHWMIVDSPHQLRSLAVTMGRHTVLLPWFNTGTSLYEFMEQDAQANRSVTIDGRAWEWPTKPYYYYDLVEHVAV